jgi:hypothetical protein
MLRGEPAATMGEKRSRQAALAGGSFVSTTDTGEEEESAQDTHHNQDTRQERPGIADPSAHAVSERRTMNQLTTDSSIRDEGQTVNEESTVSQLCIAVYDKALAHERAQTEKSRLHEAQFIAKQIRETWQLPFGPRLEPIPLSDGTCKVGDLLLRRGVYTTFQLRTPCWSCRKDVWTAVNTMRDAGRVLSKPFKTCDECTHRSERKPSPKDRLWDSLMEAMALYDRSAEDDDREFASE